MTSLAIAGLGNIGSSVVPLLPSLGIDSVLFVDKDVYEEKNLAGQSIAESYVGHPKAVMQAERLSSISSSIKVKACVDDIQNVTWRDLNCDVIMGCFDNNAARQITAEFAWRMGIPYLDSGVRRDGMFARVDVYLPAGNECPCIECGWKDSDYERLEMEYPCSKGGIQFSTNSPIYLGSLAASMQAVECARILEGNFIHGGARIMLSAHSYTCYVSRLPRNADCRFDHGTYDVGQLASIPQELTVQQVLNNEGVSIDIMNAPLYETVSRQGSSIEEHLI